MVLYSTVFHPLTCQMMQKFCREIFNKEMAKTPPEKVGETVDQRDQLQLQKGIFYTDQTKENFNSIFK